MIKEKIRDIAKKLGIEKCGFTKDAFVALFPYYVKGEQGNISMYARGMDYHRIAEEKLSGIAVEMLKLGAARTEIHVDKGKLDDRMAAYRAGLGFVGRSGMLICEEYGSYFFIGQIINDLAVDPDNPIDKGCMNCGECIRCCTGKALSENGFDIESCVSHISQKKGDLTEREERFIKKSGLCWGCDVCQLVCPHNKGLETTAMPEFMVERISRLALSDLEGLSNRGFKEKYEKYAFNWRGKGVLERNLKILTSDEDRVNE